MVIRIQESRFAPFTLYFNRQAAQK